MQTSLFSEPGMVAPRGPAALAGRPRREAGGFASACLRPLLGAACLWLGVAGSDALHAQQRPDGPAPGSRARAELLDAARASAQAQLRQPVRFAVKRLRQADGWAFLHAALLDTRDRPLNYAGTPDAAAGRHGLKSGSYDALLQRDHGRWTVRVDRIGATDVPWTNWGRDYGAPPALFADGPLD